MAIRLFESNALFVHIPKTGGTWVREVLAHCGIANDIVRVQPGMFWHHPLATAVTHRPSYTFAFVRHPLGWYESWWKYLGAVKITNAIGKWHPQRILNPCMSENFSEFVRLCLQHEPGYVTRLYEWYVGPPGWPCVDRVCRYENLADDLASVLHHVGEEFDEQKLREFPASNVSEKEFGEPVWNPELRRRILEVEAPTVRRFYCEPAKAQAA